MKGNPITLIGNEVKVGDKAPDFEVTANDLSNIRLGSFVGKICVICAVPSLDTGVCDTMTRKFNEQAASLGDDVKVLTISADLPFAQSRWCGAAGIKNVVTLSDHRTTSFGQAYGLLIKDLRLLARAVFVVDKTGVIRYAELVSEIAQEPNYAQAIKAVKELM